MDYNAYSVLKLIIIAIILLAGIIFVYMYYQGAVNRNLYRPCREVPKNSHSQQNQDMECSNKFNGLKIIKYTIPSNIIRQCLQLVDQGKRVVIPKWKSGETVPTNKMTPDIIKFYKRLAPLISNVIGEKVDITPLDLPTSCAILTYNQPGDFINWHYDVNYFNGRFFTVLMCLHRTKKTDTKYQYKDANGVTKQIDLEMGDCLVFEGPMVFHSASKIGQDQERTILSLQYSTDPMISPFNRFMMRFKDIAYIG